MRKAIGQSGSTKQLYISLYKKRQAFFFAIKGHLTLPSKLLKILSHVFVTQIAQRYEGNARNDDGDARSDHDDG